MAQMDLANGQGTAALDTTGHTDTEGCVSGGGKAPSRADSQQLGAASASGRGLAPPPHMYLPGDDGWVSGTNWVSSSTVQAQEFCPPAERAGSAAMPQGASEAGAVFSGPALGISGGFAQLYWQEQQEQQQRYPQPQPYAGRSALEGVLLGYTHHVCVEDPILCAPALAPHLWLV